MSGTIYWTLDEILDLLGLEKPSFDDDFSVWSNCFKGRATDVVFRDPEIKTHDDGTVEMIVRIPINIKGL